MHRKKIPITGNTEYEIICSSIKIPLPVSSVRKKINKTEEQYLHSKYKQT
jgi:hypothetical protein